MYLNVLNWISIFQQKLPDVLDREYIQQARQRVLKELTVVSKKVFQLILEKQSSYTGEIQRVREIEDELETALYTCQASRADLSIAKSQFTTKSLGILANYRRKQAAGVLLNSLRTIDTLVSFLILKICKLSSNKIMCYRV